MSYTCFTRLIKTVFLASLLMAGLSSVQISFAKHDRNDFVKTKKHKLHKAQNKNWHCKEGNKKHCDDLANIPAAETFKDVVNGLREKYLGQVFNNSDDADFNGKQRGNKVSVCHGRGNGRHHTIRVNKNAVAAHLAHGDKLHAC